MTRTTVSSEVAVKPPPSRKRMGGTGQILRPDKVIALLALCGLFVGGCCCCGHDGRTPAATKQGVVPGTGQPAITEAEVATFENRRMIQPGDLLLIDIPDLFGPGEDSLVVRRVSTDGTVPVPLCGPVRAAGLTDEAAATYISAQLSTKPSFLHPDVDVTTLGQSSKQPETKLSEGGK